MASYVALLENLYESNDSWKALWKSCYAKWLAWASKKKETASKPIENEHLALLIAYGDSLIEKKDEGKAHANTNTQAPLESLSNFLDEMCDGLFTGVNILPYTTHSLKDDASTTNLDSVFEQTSHSIVHHSLGAWDNIDSIAKKYHLMSDLPCMQEMKDSIERLNDACSLTETGDCEGMAFNNPLILFAVLDRLLDYVFVYNSRFIRFIANDCLWQSKTLPQTTNAKVHLVLALIRALLDEFAPHIILVVESEGSYSESLSYGVNRDEAHMLCQSPLPSLLLYSMLFEDSRYLQQWASAIPETAEHIGYLNYGDSHKGISLLSCNLPDKARDAMIAAVQQRGATVSYMSSPNGDIPCSLDTHFLAAIAPELPNSERAKMFLASQSIMLAMQGVPAVYIHSVLGIEESSQGFIKTEYEKMNKGYQLEYNALMHEITKEGSLSYEIYKGYTTLLEARTMSAAFNPTAPMEILQVKEQLFALIRSTTMAESRPLLDSTLDQNIAQNDDSISFEKVLCIVNLSSKEIVQNFALDLLPWLEGGEDLCTGDIVIVSRGKNAAGHNIVELVIEPFEILWLRFSSNLSLDDDLGQEI